MLPKIVQSLIVSSILTLGGVFLIPILAGCATAERPHPAQPLIVRTAVGAIYQLREVTVVPKAFHKVRPIYPRELRRAGVSGEALMQFVIMPDGNVANIHTVKATNPEFADAATRMLCRWTFHPATLDGSPVNVLVTMPVSFNVTQDEGE